MKNLSKKLIIGNWKMNLDYKDSISLAKKIEKKLKGQRIKNEIVLLPDFLSLNEIKKNIKNKNIFLGAQDVSPFSLGAFTGEVSLEALKQIPLKYVLIGHSERRQYFFDNSLIANKMKNVLENSEIIPILCVGETLSEREAGKTWNAISHQLQEAFAKIKSLKNKKIIIAYEPIWAIGTGKTVDVADALVVHKKIRKFIEKKFALQAPSELGVLYGGSVDLKKYANFCKLEDVSGLLIGGASLKADDFSEIALNFR